MTRWKPGIASLLFHTSVIRPFLILGGLCLAFWLGRRSPWVEGTTVVPLLLFPLVVIGLRKPVLLVQAFPIVFFAASSEWRFMGLSSLELVGFSMVGVAALRVLLRRDPFPHSNLYYPISLYALFVLVYSLMFPEHIGTQRLQLSTGDGLALYFAATVLIKNRRDVTRFVAAMTIAILVLCAKVAYAGASLPVFDVFLLGRSGLVLDTWTTWQVNQMAPILLLSALFLPDTRTRYLAVVGFLAAAAIDVITLSRAGIVDLGLILFMTIPYLWACRSSARNRWLILLPVVFVWMYRTLTGLNVVANTWETLEFQLRTGGSRWHSFLAGWRIFLSYPLWGSAMEFGSDLGPGHSYWGKIMGDYGLPFLLINVALVTLIVRDAYLLSRRDDNPTLSVVGKGMLISSLLAIWQMLPNAVLHSMHYAMIFWLLRGVTTACLNMPHEPENGE